MATTKSTDKESFSERMHQQLTDVKASVDRMLEDLEAASSRASAGLQDKRNQARAQMKAQQQEMQQADTEMKNALQAKKAEADAAVAEWKAKRNVERLEDRASLAQDYASATVAIAWGALQEANAAILDAIVARAEAEEAKKGGPTKA